MRRIKETMQTQHRHCRFWLSKLIASRTCCIEPSAVEDLDFWTRLMLKKVLNSSNLLGINCGKWWHMLYLPQIWFLRFKPFESSKLGLWQSSWGFGMPRLTEASLATRSAWIPGTRDNHGKFMFLCHTYTYNCNISNVTVYMYQSPKMLLFIFCCCC